MKKIVAILTLTLLMMATSAMALTYSPTLTDLLSFQNLGSSPVILADAPYDDGTGGAYFTTKFATIPLDNAYVLYGLNLSTPLDLTGYDKFALRITNLNENPWNFGLFVGDPYTTSAPVSIANETSDILVFDLASLTGLSNITYLGLYVTADLPIVGENGRADYTAEFSATPVPEPGTMVLLGAGLLGLAIYGKRRMNKEV